MVRSNGIDLFPVDRFHFQTLAYIDYVQWRHLPNHRVDRAGLQDVRLSWEVSRVVIAGGRYPIIG
jgi:hypothetical protein